MLVDMPQPKAETLSNIWWLSLASASNATESYQLSTVLHVKDSEVPLVVWMDVTVLHTCLFDYRISLQHFSLAIYGSFHC